MITATHPYSEEEMRSARGNSSILARLLAMFAALRDRWAADLADDVSSENERQHRLHREIGDYEDEHPQETK